MPAQPKTQKELDKLLAKKPVIAPVSVPEFYASTFLITVASNDFNLIGLRQQPVRIGDAESGTIASTAAPVFSLSMSAHSAKDLCLLLQTQIASYEKKFGKLTTEYTERNKPNLPK